MLEPLYTATEMREAEARYPGYPESMRDLMETAGRAVARITLETFPDARSFTAVCGRGNNGGDGRIAARVLAEAGRDVRIVDAKPEHGEGDLGHPDVVVDAVFGTGFTGEPRAPAARLIERINDADAHIVAVDVPSGVDASTGEVATVAVRATVTVTFHGEKLGLSVAPGRFYAGLKQVADIGLEPVGTQHARVTSEILGLVPQRAPEDNKYTAGHVLVVGGSAGMTGAPALTAAAALRADAGYVTLAAPRSSLPVFETLVLEAVKRPLPDDEDGRVTAAAADRVHELAEKAGAVCVGPGLGRSDGTKALVRRLLAELAIPVVVDADALWQLEPAEWAGPRVLTPHAGELAPLLGEDSRWVDAHRLAAVKRAVDEFGCVILLKGAGTLVGAPDAGVLVCAGFPSLATAGTGDVLTGVIGSFLAKGMDARLAAAAGATAQAEAALASPRRAGLIASDLLDTLPGTLP